MKRARWGSSELGRALVGLNLLLAAGIAAADPAPVQRLEAADFALTDSPQVPPPATAWQPLSLPDPWTLSRPGAFGTGWYRLHFDLPIDPARSYGIFLPVVWDLRSAVINGIALGGAAGGEPSPGEDGRPRLLPLPRDALRVHGNELLLRIGRARGVDGGMPTVSVGDLEELRRTYQRRVFLAVNGAQFATLLTGLVGAFVVLLWLRRRQESSYGIFGLALLLRAALGSDMFFDHAHADAPMWGWARGVLWDVFQVLLNLFMLRFAGWRWPRYERLLWGYVVLFALFALADKFGAMEASPAWSWLAEDYVPVVGYTTIALIAAWRLRTVSSILLAATTLLALLSFAYETHVPAALDLGPLWPYRFLPLYLVMGWALIDRFVRSLSEAERLNAELEQRVRDKHAELETNYRRLRDMERQQAVAEERQRIMSDMHDGVGGQLITALGLVERGDASAAEVAAALRECLENLRLIIDSLEPIEEDLLPVLGNLRYRIDGRLREQGIRLDWQVRDLPRLSCLTPQNVLHVLRILQEAFANVLKHAKASVIAVETGIDPDGRRVFIRVCDNGRGFVAGGSGRGLGNMRERARSIGGELDVKSSPTGTSVTLQLPAT